MRVLLERHVTFLDAIEANRFTADILRAHQFIGLSVNYCVIACIDLVNMVEADDAMAASQNGLEVEELALRLLVVDQVVAAIGHHDVVVGEPTVLQRIVNHDSLLLLGLSDARSPSTRLVTLTLFITSGDVQGCSINWSDRL